MAHGAEAAAQLAVGSIIVANDDEEMLRTRGTGRDSGASLFVAQDGEMYLVCDGTDDDKVCCERDAMVAKHGQISDLARSEFRASLG